LRKRLWPEQLTPRQLLIAGAALFVLSVIVTLAVLLPAGGRRSEPAAEPEAAARGEPSPLKLRARDFILDEPVEEPQPEIYFFRPPLARWSEEQVKRFWVPLNEVAQEILRQENDRRVEKIFEGVP
jgi:hypothetical protein